MGIPPVRKIVAMLVLSFWLGDSAIAAQQVKGAQPPAWLIRHSKEMESLYQSNAVAKKGVHFVFDNDLWQPGNTYVNGSRWLALSCVAKGCVLEEAMLAVKKESWQGHYDEYPTQGQRLRFSKKTSSPGKAIAWFQPDVAQPWLKPGAVATYYSVILPRKQPLGRGSLEAQVDLPDGGTALLVPMALSRARLPYSDYDGLSYDTVLLQLRSHGNRQLLPGHLGECSGGLPFGPNQYLQWAGDMDGDNKPDYLISYIDADGPVHLYLSGVARPGQLVGVGGVYFSPPFGGECDGGGWAF